MFGTNFSSAVLVTCFLTFAGCSALSPTPFSFAEAESRQIRAMTMECIRRNEGLGIAYGFNEVTMGCKENARRWVGARLPR